jgi:hypothetical protein
MWFAPTLLLALADCGGEAQEAPPGGEVAYSTIADVSWIDADTLLLHADYPRRDWVVARASGAAFPLDAFAEYAPIDPSPDGARLLTWGGYPGELRTVTVEDAARGSASVRTVPLPAFAESDEYTEKQDATWAFWVDDSRALVVQGNAASGYERCYVHDAETGAIEPSTGCLAGAELPGIGLPTRVTRLGANQYAIYTSDEGTVYISIVRVTPEIGATPVLPSITYPGLCIVDVYRDRETDVIHLASRVPLAPDGGYAEAIVDFPEKGPWRLYRWTQDAGFVATDRTIPHKARLRSGPDGEVAWIDRERSRLCTRSSDSEDVCHPLPTEIRLDESLW